MSWEVENLFWLYAGFDLRTQRNCAALSWGFRPDAEPGESIWKHELVIHAPNWPIIYCRDEAGRVWPCGFMAFGYCRMWDWHMP